MWIALDTCDPEWAAAVQPGVAAAARQLHLRRRCGGSPSQIDWLGNGTNAGYHRTITYNAKGQIATEYTSTKRGNDTFTASTTNGYGSGAGYALGSATSATTSQQQERLAAIDHDHHQRLRLVGRGGSRPRPTIVTDNVSGADTNYTTSYYYGPSGQLASVYIGDGRPRTVTFITDMAGQIIRRDEADGNTGNGDPARNLVPLRRQAARLYRQ